jgi:hypothetical protein
MRIVGCFRGPSDFIIYISLSLFFVVMGFEFKAYTLSHSTSSFFVMGFFGIGSLELFAQDGFKL